MAHPDRNLGPVGQPDTFAAMTSGLFSEQKTNRFSAELSGFRGPFAEDIADWQKNRLGRVVGAPLTVEPTSGSVSKETRYRSMIYALPYTDESTKGFDKKVLLVFPTDDAVEVLLVKPREVSSSNPDEDAAENQRSLADFNTLFSPHDKPFVVDNWEPDPHLSASEAFVKDASFFPIESASDENTAPGYMLDRALHNAKLVKKRHDAREAEFRSRLEEVMLDDMEGEPQEPESRQETPDKKTGIEGISIGNLGEPVIFQYYEARKSSAPERTTTFSIPASSEFDIDLVTAVEDSEEESGVREDRVSLGEGVSSMGIDHALKRAKDLAIKRELDIKLFKEQYNLASATWPPQEQLPE